jgi:hypothetical protein
MGKVAASAAVTDIAVGSIVTVAGHGLGKVTSIIKGGWHSVLLSDDRRVNVRRDKLELAPVPAALPSPSAGPEIADAPVPLAVAAKKLAQKPESTAVPLGTTKASRAKAAKVESGSEPGSAPGSRKPKVAAATNACCCGCGAMVAGYFKQGHDARFHGWMVRIADGRTDPKDVPASAVKLMNLKSGIPTTDYDGRTDSKWVKSATAAAKRA